MKKFHAVILLGVMLLTSAYTPVTDSKLPSWVPKDAEIRADLVKTFNSELEYAEVLRSGCIITNAFIIDGWITIKVKRGALLTTIVVGKFDNVKDLTIKDGKLQANYQSKKQFGWFEFGAGVVVGSVAMSILLGLTK